MIITRVRPSWLMVSDEKENLFSFWFSFFFYPSSSSFFTQVTNPQAGRFHASLGHREHTDRHRARLHGPAPHPLLPRSSGGPVLPRCPIHPFYLLHAKRT